MILWKQKQDNISTFLSLALYVIPSSSYVVLLIFLFLKFYFNTFGLVKWLIVDRSSNSNKNEISIKSNKLIGLLARQNNRAIRNKRKENKI